jgi:hypothetical protein
MTTSTDTLAKLDDLRRQHGPETIEGRIISNAIEQIKKLEHARGDQRAELIRFLDDTMERMAKLPPPRTDD